MVELTGTIDVPPSPISPPPATKDDGAIAIEGAGIRSSRWTRINGVFNALLIQAKFDYGDGGESVVVRVQTSLDEGATAIDLVCLGFEKESGLKLVNISGLTPRMPFTPEPLKPGAINDGVVGDHLRWQITSKGVYVRTSLTLRLVPRV